MLSVRVRARGRLPGNATGEGEPGEEGPATGTVPALALLCTCWAWGCRGGMGMTLPLKLECNGLAFELAFERGEWESDDSTLPVD